MAIWDGDWSAQCSGCLNWFVSRWLYGQPCQPDRMARIEAVTPEGMMYATDAFAAVLSPTRQPHFTCNLHGRGAGGQELRIDAYVSAMSA